MAWIDKSMRPHRRLIVEPIAHATSDGNDISGRRGSGKGCRTFEFRKQKVGIRIAALIRSKPRSDETIEVVGWKRNRGTFPNSAHSDTSQQDRSARPSRAEWLTALPVRDLRVEKNEVLEIDPWSGPRLVRPAKRQGLRACLQAARTPEKANALKTVRHNLVEHRLGRATVKQAKDDGFAMLGRLDCLVPAN